MSSTARRLCDALLYLDGRIAEGRATDPQPTRAQPHRLPLGTLRRMSADLDATFAAILQNAPAPQRGHLLRAIETVEDVARRGDLGEGPAIVTSRRAERERRQAA